MTTHSRSTTLADLVQLAQEAAKPPVEKSKFRVFVFGPSLNPADTVVPPTIEPTTHDAIVEHAKYLRFVTKKALEAEGFTVDYGETREIYEMWSKLFSKGDVGSFELHHARSNCGAIVVFPSSVGSICELTLFAPVEKIAKKTLAIIHDTYTNQDSFFRNAVVAIFQQENGAPQFLDYRNHAACAKAAVVFVEGKWQKFLRGYDKLKDSAEWGEENAGIFSK